MALLSNDERAQHSHNTPAAPYTHGDFQSRYFIPADGDDPSHPNVFQLPSGLVGSGTVRCGDVERHFPLPGRFHFRFKKKFRDAFGEVGFWWLVVTLLMFCTKNGWAVVAERRVRKGWLRRFVLLRT